jgi:hypothetical protein
MLMALAACGVGTPPGGEQPAATRVHFDAADVQTRAGSYDGYSVVRPCPISTGGIGVVGMGDACFYGVPCGDYDARFKASQRFRAGLREELAGVWSGDGFGARCTPGDRMSVHLSVYDSRAVDDVIRRVGARLRADGSGEEVVIAVAGDPMRY